MPYRIYVVILPASILLNLCKQKKRFFVQTIKWSIEKARKKNDEKKEKQGKNKTMKMIKKTLTETMRWNGDNAFKWRERGKETEVEVKGA